MEKLVKVKQKYFWFGPIGSFEQTLFTSFESVQQSRPAEGELAGCVYGIAARAGSSCLAGHKSFQRIQVFLKVFVLER